MCVTYHCVLRATVTGVISTMTTRGAAPAANRRFSASSIVRASDQPMVPLKARKSASPVASRTAYVSSVALIDLSDRELPRMITSAGRGSATDCSTIDRMSGKRTSGHA